MPLVSHVITEKYDMVKKIIQKHFSHHQKSIFT